MLLTICVFRSSYVGIGLVYYGLLAIVIPWCCGMLVSAAVTIAFCLLVILGNGDLLVYPFLSVPTSMVWTVTLSCNLFEVSKLVTRAS